MCHRQPLNCIYDIKNTTRVAPTAPCLSANPGAPHPLRLYPGASSARLGQQGPVRPWALACAALEGPDRSQAAFWQRLQARASADEAALPGASRRRRRPCRSAPATVGTLHRPPASPYAPPPATSSLSRRAACCCRLLPRRPPRFPPALPNCHRRSKPPKRRPFVPLAVPCVAPVAHPSCPSPPPPRALAPFLTQHLCRGDSTCGAAPCASGLAVPRAPTHAAPHTYTTHLFCAEPRRCGRQSALLHPAQLKHARRPPNPISHQRAHSARSQRWQLPCPPKYPKPHSTTAAAAA